MTQYSSLITGDYVELHLHTAYSFLDGASQIEELMNRACELDYRALAITDHDNLAGAMAFAQYAKIVEIQPITGAELTLDVSGRRCHLTLLAENPEGYANLCRLLTDACDPERRNVPGSLAPWERVGVREEQSPRSKSPHPNPLPGGEGAWLPAAALEGRTRGLIALSGCRHGLLCQLIDEGRLTDAEAAGRWLRDLFGGHALYLELQRHLVKGDERRVQRLVELAERLNVDVVATGNVHYHERARHRLQDAMVAIKHRSTLEGSHQLRRPNSEFFLQTPAEMAARFHDLPQAIQSTREIAERCSDFDLTEDLGYRFPEFRRDVRPGGGYGTEGTQGTEETQGETTPLPALPVRG